MIQSDVTTVDIGETRLQLKNGLRFAARQGRGTCWYLIEDTSTGQFFRLGRPEYTFLSMLDGKQTVSSAMAVTCSLLGGDALDENETFNLCQWLVNAGLAHTEASTASSRIVQRQQKAAAQQNLQNLNLISIRFPLFELDRFATVLNRYAGWIVSWPMAIAVAIIYAWGWIAFASNCDRLSQFHFFSRDNVLWLTLTWIVLKLFHEMGHMLACKRFGGHVGRGGILLLLLIPMPFVDVTSAWRFSRKSQRILTSAAGMLVELFLAAIAAIVWSQAEPGPVAYHAFNIMVTASLHTVLFNANPLMRFDGYYILSDALDLPNLQQHGTNYVRALGRRIFFGLGGKDMEYLGIHGQFVKVFGWASALWKTLLCVTLTVAAANLFSGVGLLIAAMSIALWLALPLYSFVKYLIQGTEFETPDRKRFAVVTTLFGLTVWILGSALPAPTVVSAPAVIEYKDRQVLHAETSGFIDEIHASESELVEKGQLLLVLRFPDHDVKRAQLDAELAQAKLRARTHWLEDEVGLWQSEMARIHSIREQLEEVITNQQRLYIHAPESGMVVISQLTDRLGTFVRPGDELLTIGKPGEMEAVALVSQFDAQFLRGSESEPAKIRLYGGSRTISAICERINPRAQNNLPHFAFAGTCDGPLDVIPRQEVESSGAADIVGDKDQWMLTKPRVKVTLALHLENDQTLWDGQLGTVQLKSRDQSLNQFAASQFARWFRSKITTTHGL